MIELIVFHSNLLRVNMTDRNKILLYYSYRYEAVKRQRF